MARLAGVLLMAMADAIAQEKISRQVVVSIPDRKLAVVENGRVVKVYTVAVGKPNTPTPDGRFQIENKIPNPTWYTPGRIVPPGPANPLGTRWLGLSVDGFGIHGTNNPNSIGHAASHGCIRMAKADIEELFSRVQVGDAVEFHAERDTVVAALFSAEKTPAPAGASAAGGQ
jgi:lipoprotein-anchoring transpeptidase ErfK/SrfK